MTKTRRKLPHVIVIGGGVAGLSAAHELLKHNIRVTVFEKNLLPGGKARSLPVPETEYQPLPNKRTLPGEHGFRFFPGFYNHLQDTLEEIPSSLEDGSTVADELINVEELNYARLDGTMIVTSTKLPRKLSAVFKTLKSWSDKDGLNLSKWEVLTYVARLLRFFSSCNERIDEEYDRVSWWNFIRAEKKSQRFKRYVGNGSRILVAADPLKASARTSGRITEQFMTGNSGRSSDRILQGPTNQIWIFPWVKQLLSHDNFTLISNASVDSIEMLDHENIVSSISVNNNSKNSNLQQIISCDPMTGPVTVDFEIADENIADYYIAAVPIEKMAHYLVDSKDELKKPDSEVSWSRLGLADEKLRTQIWELRHHLQWMSGIVYYLKGSPTSIRGHTIYVDSPFALSSIFQSEYWRAPFTVDQFGDGELTRILSIVVSNWNDSENCSGPSDCTIPNGGLGREYGKTACKTLLMDAAKTANKDKKLISEIWQDHADSMNRSEASLNIDPNIEHVFVDPAIQITGSGTQATNSEPLLVNRVNSYHLRPTSDTRVKNLFLAADYVKTHTDLATMEAANEAAKTAVNHILNSLNSNQARAKIHPFKRTKGLGWARAIDRVMFKSKQFLIGIWPKGN